MIALYGEKRVGKDTTADIILKYKPLKRVAFADLPKEIFCKTLNITREELEENKEKYRPALNRFSEEMKNHFGKDVWAKVVKDENVIITDLRFIEEYEYIKKFNPIIIHIVDKNKKEENIHNLPFHFEIDNTEKDLKVLEDNIIKILEKL